MTHRVVVYKFYRAMLRREQYSYGMSSVRPFVFNVGGM